MASIVAVQAKHTPKALFAAALLRLTSPTEESPASATSAAAAAAVAAAAAAMHQSYQFNSQ
jgi:hypothetical protein